MRNEQSDWGLIYAGDPGGALSCKVTFYEIDSADDILKALGRFFAAIGKAAAAVGVPHAATAAEVGEALMALLEALGDEDGTNLGLWSHDYNDQAEIDSEDGKSRRSTKVGYADAVLGSLFQRFEYSFEYMLKKTQTPNSGNGGGQ